MYVIRGMYITILYVQASVGAAESIQGLGHK